MRRRFSRAARGAALGMALLLLAAVAPAVRADEGQLAIVGTRTTSFPKVFVRVAASDPGGAPIGGLQAADFVVRENGRAATYIDVQTMRQSPTPLAIVLVVDVSGSMRDQGKLDRAREAANSFISKLRRIDQVELISFSTTVSTVVPLTNDRWKLAEGLRKLAAGGDTAIYDAVYAAVGSATRMPGNRVIMVLTDGEDTASKSRSQQPVDLAVEVGIPVYTVGLGLEVKDEILGKMAESTFGRYFKAPGADDLIHTFNLLSRQIQNEYELVYVSPLADSPGTDVRVEVVVPREGRLLATTFAYRTPRAVQKDPVPGGVEAGRLMSVPRPEPPEPPRPIELPEHWVEFAAALAALGVVAGLRGVVVLATPTRMETRLTTYVGAAGERSHPRLPRVRFNPVRWAARAAYRRVIRLLPGQWLEETRALLIQAGNPYGQGLDELMALRVVGAVTLAGATVLVFPAIGASELVVPLAFACGAIGFLLPIVWLKSRIRRRRSQILRAMPNALDLLAVSVEAGLGFDQSLAEVCTKWQNPLTQEFTLMLNELRLGRTRKEALQGLMKRTGVQELGTFASALVQADELGASITRTLTIQAEQIRVRRRQRAQESAHKAGVKMAFPLVFLMLRALFVVVIGPSVPNVLNTLANVAR